MNVEERITPENYSEPFGDSLDDFLLSISNQEETTPYNPFKYPPSLKEAIKHGKHKAFGKIISNHTCKCCSSYQKQRYNLTKKSKKMLDSDDSMAIYKTYSQFLLTSCLILSLTSFYTIYQFQKFYCEKGDKEGKECYFELKNIFIFSENQFYIQRFWSILGEVVSVSTISLILLRIARAYYSLKCDEIEEKFVEKIGLGYRELTIMVTRASEDTSLEQVKRIIDKRLRKFGYDAEYKILKSFLALREHGALFYESMETEIEQKLQDARDVYKNLENEKMKKILEKKMKKLVNRIKEKKTKRERILSKVEKKPQKNGIYFITFSSRSAVKKILKSSKREISCLKFFRTYSNQLKMIQGVSPDTIIYKNIGCYPFQRYHPFVYLTKLLIIFSYTVVIKITTDIKFIFKTKSEKKNLEYFTNYILPTLVYFLFGLATKKSVLKLTRKIKVFSKERLFTMDAKNLSEIKSLAIIISMSMKVTQIVYLEKNGNINLALSKLLTYFYTISFGLEILREIFDPRMLIKFWKKRKILKLKKNGKNILMFQEDLNQIFEPSPPNFYKKYATLNYLFLIVIVYIVNFPIAPLLLFFFISIKFQIDKFLIVKFCKNPEIKYFTKSVKDFIKGKNTFFWILMGTRYWFVVLLKFEYHSWSKNFYVNILIDFGLPIIVLFLPWESLIQNLFGRKKVKYEGEIDEFDLDCLGKDYEYYVNHVKV